MRSSSGAPRLKPGKAAASAWARSTLRRLGAPLARPVFARIYARVDARTAMAVRAQVGGLDEVAEQLELARTAAVASATSARELRREHLELKAQLTEVEGRLARLTARADGHWQPDPGTEAEAAPPGHEQPAAG